VGMTKKNILQKIFDPNVMVITFFNVLLIIDIVYIATMFFSDFERQLAVFFAGILIMFLFDLWWLTRRYIPPE
jgi:small basic protein